MAQRLTPLLRGRPVASLTAEDAAAVLAGHPTVADYFTRMDRAARSKTRTRLLGSGWAAEFVDILLPEQKRGARPVAPAAEGSPWLLLTGPARLAIADALGVEELPRDAAAWTPERATVAADAIAARYPNATTATLALGKLRSVLALIYAPATLPAAVRTATLRPELTEAHNERGAERLAERVAAGVEAPEPFRRLADLRARVAAFIAGETPASAQTLADVLVVFAARPGEAERLRVGERGGLTGITAGVLKKRGADGGAVYPIVSALGEETARDLLAAWKSVTAGARMKAKRDLSSLCAGWGIQPRDLRAVGASLAVRAATLDGAAANPGQRRETLRGALRHEPERAQALEHYERVNDPLAQVCAQLAELSIEDRTRIAYEIARIYDADR